MGMKDFDFKQFMLQRGEWVGVGVAVAIMLPALVIGAQKALTSGSASTNAAEVERLAKDAKSRIDRSVPPADADKPPDETNLQVRTDKVDAEKYAIESPWFWPSSIEDTKRRAPPVLPPAELVATEIRAGMLGNDYEEINKTLYVRVIEEKQATLSPKQRRLRDRLKNSGFKSNVGGMGGMMGGMMPGMGGQGRMMGGGSGMMAGGMMGGGMGRGGPGGKEGAPGMGGLGQRPGNTIKQAEWKEADKVGNDRLAQRLYPFRMIEIVGSFPYKQQLESFRGALRMRNLGELMSKLNSPEAVWEFKAPEVQRREFDLHGRLLKDWEEKYDAKMIAKLKYIMARAIEAEKEDPDLEKWKDFGVINAGLVWGRPQLELPYEPKGYPKIETTIGGISKTIEELKKESEQHNIKPPNQVVLKAKGGFDPTNPFNPTGLDDTKQEETPKEGDTENKDKDKDKAPGENDPVVAEHCLVRLLDVGVEPGKRYEYRLRIKMKNPNHGLELSKVAYPKLAKDEYIYSDWVTVPPVTVPDDVNWYIVDEKPDRERLTVQVHKWLGEAQADPKNEKYTVPVADWVVLDRSLPTAASVYRGEFIGRPAAVQVPTWDMKKEDWEFARNPSGRSSNVPVDFTVRPEGASHPALLIDYDGGKGRQTHTTGKRLVEDNAPVQVLVLSPEDKLELRSSLEDVNDKERKERYDNWKKRRDEVRNPRKSEAARGKSDLFQGGAKP
jgi:hypothetical protein